MTRRDYLRLLPGAAIVSSGFHVRAAELIVEEQRGDPNLPAETLQIERETLVGVLSANMKAVFEAQREDFPAALAATALTMAGSSRLGTPKRIQEILSLYKLPMRYTNGSFVPFCAAGVGYSAVLAYADLLSKTLEGDRIRSLRQLLPDIEHWYFYPTVSCVDMHLVEQGKRRWIDARANRTTPRRGWIVLYSWTRPDRANHCVIILECSSNQIKTLEFNTSGTVNGNQVNGGTVVIRERPYDQKVMGFIATDRGARL